MDKTPPKSDISPQEEGKNSRFQCPDCELTFAQVWNMRRHELAFHWNKQFRCTACSISFTRQDHLRRHVRICKGALITGRIISIQPLDAILGPVASTSGDTAVSQATHRRGLTQIRKVPKKRVAPWTPPASAFFHPKSSKDCDHRKGDARKKLERELFGTVEEDEPSPSGQQQSRMDLEQDLCLSDSSSEDENVQLSEVEEEDTPSIPPTQENDKPDNTLAEAVLHMLSDLSRIQDANMAGNTMSEAITCLQQAHTTLQEIIKKNLK